MSLQHLRGPTEDFKLYIHTVKIKKHDNPAFATYPTLQRFGR
jgi:hypothetical protein